MAEAGGADLGAFMGAPGAASEYAQAADLWRQQDADRLANRSKNYPQSPRTADLYGKGTGAQNTLTDEEYAEEDDSEMQAYLLDTRGISLIKSGRDEITASMAINNTSAVFSSIATFLNSIGKATIEIVIGIAFLAGGLVMSALSFTTRTTAQLTEKNGQTKIQRGEKMRIEAARLRGKGGVQSRLKNAAGAIFEKGVNRIGDVLNEISPIPLPIKMGSLQDAKDYFNRLIITFATYFLAAVLTLALLVTVVIAILESICHATVGEWACSLFPQVIFKILF